jgi:hypothetical protein
LDSPPEETPDAEAEAVGGVVKRSMLRTRLERNGWKKNEGEITREIL